MSCDKARHAVLILSALDEVLQSGRPSDGNVEREIYSEQWSWKPPAPEEDHGSL